MGNHVDFADEINIHFVHKYITTKNTFLVMLLIWIFCVLFTIPTHVMLSICIDVGRCRCPIPWEPVGLSYLFCLLLRRMRQNECWKPCQNHKRRIIVSGLVPVIQKMFNSLQVFLLIWIVPLQLHLVLVRWLGQLRARNTENCLVPVGDISSCLRSRIMDSLVRLLPHLIPYHII